MLTRTDRQKVAAAFRSLRKMGFFARMNFSCCQSCGFYEADDVENIVFFHRQDTASGFSGDTITPAGLLLAWSGNANAIVAALREQGLPVEWNGDAGQRILVRSCDARVPVV